MRKPWIKDRHLALGAGILAIVAGSALLYDAYENRGRQRPFAIKWLPGA